jgi:hypothetical protein
MSESKSEVKDAAAAGAACGDLKVPTSGSKSELSAASFTVPSCGKPVYVFRIHNERNFERHFVLDDLDKVSAYFYQYLTEQMLEYYCDGCPRCCHGEGSNQEWCEMSFTKDSDLGSYFELCRRSRPHLHRITASICLVEFAFTHPAPMDVGWVRREVETPLWTFDTSCEFENFHKIKMIVLHEFVELK